jgi:glyoxylase-like metal-dependent hydrolase (beta-lactamase superfamily II)
MFTLLFRQLFDAASSTYTYLLGEPRTGRAIIIDTVFEQHLRDFALLRELDLELDATIDTHCHADHVTGAWLMQSATGCRIAVSRRYEPPIQNADLLLDHGDRIVFGPRHLDVLATPGHTEGCMTLVLDDRSMAFTGDALLIRGAGRCDFQRGSAHTLYRSIVENIFTLPDECLIFPAHDYSGRTVSSVAEERMHNPRIGGRADERDFVGFMQNLDLPHPKQIDIAVPANLKCGRPEKTPVLDPLMEPDWAPLTYTFGGIWEVQPHWLEEHLRDVQVLDVREPDEFNGPLGHVPHAKLVPLGSLTKSLSQLAKDKPIVAVCRSGARSAQATVLLGKAGFDKVANLSGGMLRWRSQRFSVEGGTD